jgi:putative FmdB family regulatory protein
MITQRPTMGSLRSSGTRGRYHAVGEDVVSCYLPLVPTYDYECDSCKKRFEYFQSMNDPRKTVCEECGGKLERVIVGAAFHLKGGGWYKDGYGDSKSAPSGSGGSVTAPNTSSSSGSSESSSTPAASETKTETKTETPAPAKADK